MNRVNKLALPIGVQLIILGAMLATFTSPSKDSEPHNLSYFIERVIIYHPYLSHHIMGCLLDAILAK